MKTVLLLTGISIVVLTSCSNENAGKPVTDSMPGVAKTDSIPAKPNPSFAGKWSSNNGADSLEISEDGASYMVTWKSQADGYTEHEINCEKTGEELTGDYYGEQKNVHLKMNGDKLLFSVNPFAEFAPVKDQLFTRVN